MKEKDCRNMAVVRQALQSGHWDAGTRRHFEACTECRQMARIQIWLNQFADSLPAETVPLTPQFLWIRAELAERQRTRKKALRPLVFLQTGFQLLMGIAFAFLMGRYWHRMEALFQTVSNGEVEWLLGVVNHTSLLFILAAVVSLGLLAICNNLAYRR